jgi:FkbM family methyltransferase
MADPKTWRSRVQTALINLYKQLQTSRAMQSETGQRLFEHAYTAYKVMLEAGPIGQLCAYVSPSSLVIDVGANIGFFTLRFARWLRNGGHVIAIEPEAANFTALKRRISMSGLDDRVVAVQAIAAEEKGTLNLEINPHHPADHKIGKIGAPTAALTLDSLLSDPNSLPVSLIKIDVQGAEMRVLRGATAILDRYRPALFVEIDDNALRHQGSSAAEVVALLAQYGYRPYKLRRFNKPAAVDPAEIGTGEGYRDLLFLAEGLSFTRKSR